MFFKQIRQLDEILAPLLGGDFAPCRLERFAGDGDGDVDVFFGGFVNGYDGLLGGRVDGLEGFAILAFDEFVVDESVGDVSTRSWWGFRGGCGVRN